MKLFYAFVLSLVAASGFSQQLPLFTQYREYSSVINPATVPNDYLWYEKPISFGASYRRQWITDKDGPSTQVLRGDYFWERGSMVSPILGGYLMHDQAGRVGLIGAYARAAMLFSDNPVEHGISVGLSAGAVRYGLNLTNARLRDAGDLAAVDARNKLFFDAGLGAYAYTTLGNSHMLFGGLSMPQVLGLDVRFRDEDRDLTLRRERHYYATAGYRLPLRNEDSFLELSSWVRFIPPLKPSFDANLRFQIDQLLFFGAGAGTNGFAHLEAGLVVGEDNLIRLGMGADFPFTQYSTYYGTSLEVNVAYAMDRR